jgi:type I restriction enzyme S subunit
MQLVTGSTVYHLYGSDMSKFIISYPKKEEQTHIATILSDMDTEIESLEKQLSKYKQLKQGLMQNLLTGKIRLV